MKIENSIAANFIRNLYLGIYFFIVGATASFAIIYKSLTLFYIGLALFVLTCIIISLLSYQFLIVVVEPERIFIRYKGLNPLFSENSSIEILATNFAGYKIQPAVFGLRKNLHLFVNTHGGVAEYPTINLNLLEQTQVEKVEKALTLLQTTTSAK
ncbi:MAG: hypothetical protein MJ069_08215 [Salinivirgaceae bacterium]|nr:hypothetical protein [Salinivirgaceae bacterium]